LQSLIKSVKLQLTDDISFGESKFEFCPNHYFKGDLFYLLQFF